jgi:hypothetical protein
MSGKLSERKEMQIRICRDCINEIQIERDI